MKCLCKRFCFCGRSILFENAPKSYEWKLSRDTSFFLKATAKTPWKQVNFQKLQKKDWKNAQLIKLAQEKNVLRTSLINRPHSFFKKTSSRCQDKLPRPNITKVPNIQTPNTQDQNTETPKTLESKFELIVVESSTWSNCSVVAKCETIKLRYPPAISLHHFSCWTFGGEGRLLFGEIDQSKLSGGVAYKFRPKITASNSRLPNFDGSVIST